MSDPTVTCPHCQKAFKLNESLAAPLIQATQATYERRIAEQREAIEAREAQVREELASVEVARAGVDAEVTARVAAVVAQERTRISAAEQERARLLAAADLAERDQKLADLTAALTQRDGKLAEAQAQQIELIRSQRALEDEKRELGLTVEKRVQDLIGAARQKARADGEQAMALKLREREEVIAAMQRQVEDLKRRAEQGSQQLQGEVAELILEEALRARFPHDQIVPVPKGVTGADCLQLVYGADGQLAGSIIWESKRAQKWSDAWLGKVRSDQRTANADLCLIVSHTLPTGVEHFDQVDAVWIAHPRCAFSLASALRQTLINVSGARRASEGQQSKSEMLYAFLTGPRFKHHVEAIVEAFNQMQLDLEQERRTMTRRWAKREGQIRSVVDATAGMWGGIQGIAGSSVQEIDGLNMELLEAPEMEED